jgi:hypothetical protein
MQLSAEDGAVRDVCWSSALGIPLRIMQGSAAAPDAHATLWRVTSISTRRPLQGVWTVDVNGYVRVNADDDIDPSSD